MVTKSINCQLTVHQTVNYTAALKRSQPSSGVISLLLDHIRRADSSHCDSLCSSLCEHLDVFSTMRWSSEFLYLWFLMVLLQLLLTAVEAAEEGCSSKVHNLNYNLLTQNNTSSVMIWFSSTCWGDVTSRGVVRRVAAKLLFVVLSVVEHSHRTCLVLSIWPLELRIIQRLPGYWSHQTPSRQQETWAKAGKTYLSSVSLLLGLLTSSENVLKRKHRIGPWQWNV